MLLWYSVVLCFCLISQIRTTIPRRKVSREADRAAAVQRRKTTFRVVGQLAWQHAPSSSIYNRGTKIRGCLTTRQAARTTSRTLQNMKFAGRESARQTELENMQGRMLCLLRPLVIFRSSHRPMAEFGFVADQARRMPVCERVGAGLLSSNTEYRGWK